MIKWKQKFENNQFSITWTDIKIGLLGYEDDKKRYYLSSQLTESDIEEYAEFILTECEGLSESILRQVGNLFSQNWDEKVKTIESLANEDDEQSYFKWRVLEVEVLLQELYANDYLNGLFEINEFWAERQEPIDMPYQFQGFGNTLTPEEFYTENNYKAVIAEHQVWLELEKKRIISLEIVE